MKTLLLALLLLTSSAAFAQTTFKGGILSTTAPWPHGGDWVMSLNGAGYFAATTSIDSITYGIFSGTVDYKGRLVGHSTAGHTITGRVSIKNGRSIFVGRIRGHGLAYKVQAVVGIFN